MLHTFTLAVSKEWAPRWQGCRCPCSSIHPQLRGLSPRKLQRRVRVTTVILHQQTMYRHTYMHIYSIHGFILDSGQVLIIWKLKRKSDAQLTK